MAFYVASHARPETSEPDVHSVTVEKFRVSDGARLATDHPVTKAAMLYLAEAWPQVVPFDRLLSAAHSRLGLDSVPLRRTAATQDDAKILAANLLTAYGYGGNLVELHVHAPHMVLDVSEKPVASPVARFQAQNNARITNLRHERVRLNEFDRYLLRHLDGRHDRAALVEALAAGPVAEGMLVIQQDGDPIENAERARDVLADGVEKSLRWLARAALLVG
jgi:hypothetical protein